MKPSALGGLLVPLVLSLACPLAAQIDGDPPDLSNWPHPKAPLGNPFPRSTATQAELDERDTIVRLGKALFWEEQVSVDNTMACGTCHIPESGGTDRRLGAVFSAPGTENDGNLGAMGVIAQSLDANGKVAYGIAGSTSAARRITPVHTPTMIGAYMFRRQFWDGRVTQVFKDEAGVNIPNFTTNASLEGQSTFPPLSDTEMGHAGLTWAGGLLQTKLNASRPLALVNPATVPADLVPMVTSGKTYDILFDEAFGARPQFGGNLGVTRERFAMAIAHYERTLLPDHAPIDLGTMTPDQIAGFNLMHAPRAQCFTCHSVSGNPTLDASGRLVNPQDNLFSDGLRIHQIGITATQRKTPTLRNVGLQVKFFSNGHGGDGVTKIRVTNLDELITFYDNQPGGGVINLGFTGTLTATERAQVRDFLENALTDPRVAAAQFPFDRPQLASERPEFAPFEVNEYGVGHRGGTPHVPNIIANALPHVSAVAGAPSWFKIGVGGAAPTSACVLFIAPNQGPGPTDWLGGPETAVFSGRTTADGFQTAFTPFPLTPAAIGIPVFAQWQVLANHVGSVSNGAQFVPFQF